MNVSLPDALKEYVDGRVGVADYGSASEYIRELIRRDRDREKLRSLVLEGAAGPMTERTPAEVGERLRARAGL